MRASDFSRGLLLTTVLSSGAILLVTGSAAAQTFLGCSDNGTECVFSNGPTSETPFAWFSSGSNGSGSTDGGDGDSQTFGFASDIDVALPGSGNPSALLYGAEIISAGGEGSSGGPSAGGDGGNLTVNAPDSATFTVGDDFSTAYQLNTIIIQSFGGSGNDDNSNNGSNGGAGGAGGAITYNGAETSASLLTTLSGTTGPGPIATISLQSVGGQGGRGNESTGFTPDGGAGGDGGAITADVGTVVLGTASAPVSGQAVWGVEALSQGGSGPDQFNDGDDQGGGGASTGGSGGSVTLTAHGAVSVTGLSVQSLRGLYAESLGGNGGWSYDVGVDNDLTDGGDGGGGGTVSLTSMAQVSAVQTGTTASQISSAALFALSAGGGGGVGQSGTTGGAGGDGGSVSVTVGSANFGGTNLITATGTAVDAIAALSFGGGGGAGLSDANDSTGGVGGDGGTVTVTVNAGEGQVIAANASSAGSDSGRAVVAQSIGEFGGAGGDGNAVFGSPGGAGAGGNGGAVTVTVNGGTLNTDGSNSIDANINFAHGILAQSIGGGGGDGGDFSGLFGGEAGAGGKGGNGADVSVTNAGTIQANGVQANGILAQSIGGGGGSGGVADGLVVALGGSGGDGGASGTVGVDNSGTILTSGYGAAGILAQSIVGAGGAAGVADAVLSLGATAGSDSDVAPGTVTVGNTGSVTTQANAAIGVHAQSIGGGGGSASGAASSSYGVFTLGTDGGGGGDGGTVNVTDVGAIVTRGAFGYGLAAQSIGGGGGNGGDAFAGGIFDIPATAIGGQSGGGGNGGTVTVTNTAAFQVNTAGVGATGVLAQSVGGGGGSGGDATTDTAFDLTQLSLGGSGSDGGAGGAASVTLDGGTITTTGARAAGVKVQSIGGGGGSGGTGTSSSFGLVSIGFALGGTAAGGGSGDTASADLSATTVSTGAANDAIGVLAQSIGGGGGTGGSAAASAITTGVPIDPEDPDVTVTLNAQFALGGAGGDGGSGGTAAVTAAAGSTVSTSGAGSHGLLAQSIGGGGGSGGDASTATTTFPDSTEQYGLTINASLGGAGGNGGSGGAATATLGDGATNASTITTSGDYANALMVQSIGGGGGNTGIPNSTTNQLRGQGNVNVTLNLGMGNVSDSDLGADGGTATANLYGEGVIGTTGDGARGIVAQSIGGGGGAAAGGELSLGGTVSTDSEDGDGTYAGNVTVNLGGTGGPAGAGGAVDVYTDTGSQITTTGADADGILVQSVGGGGGLAGSVGSSGNTASGDDDDDDDDDDTNINVTLTASVGGKGGNGGDGGTITMDYATVMNTYGDRADGVVVQSIGGGGGVGGTALSSGTGETAQLDLSVGGKGGGGGDGGSVTVDSVNFAPGAVVNTFGYNAHGVVLQSIGAGGGQGGDGSDSASGQLTVGGGVGGSGGTAGDGNSVSLTNSVVIATQGADSYALLAQSIGGGGGLGAAGNADSTNDDDSGSDDDSDDDDGDYAIQVAVGGNGGASGDGGDVTLDLTTTAATTGERAFGFVAQSIGGGGGIGGAGDADNIASLSIGGQGGAAGDGGTVGVTISGGQLTTSGTGAHAVIVQSIGGGGGIAGASGTGPIQLIQRDNGTDGTGGDVTVDVDMTLTTTGDNAYGIIAQSIGGGGGLSGDSGGASAVADMTGTYDSGTVTISQAGTLQATGAGSVGIFAQTNGTNSDATSQILIEGGVNGGTGVGGVGVQVVGGIDNTLTIHDGAAVRAGSGGVAVDFTSEQTTAEGGVLTVDVDSGGTLSGSVTGSNADGDTAITINNGSDNSLVNGALYEAHVNNDGRFVLGSGEDVTDAVTVTGDLVQSRAGTLVAAADFYRGRAATLHVEGDARLAGTVTINAVALSPDEVATVLTVGGTIRGGLEVADARAVDYALTRDGDAFKVRAVDTRFAAAFAELTRNQSTAGSHLDAIFDAGGGRYARTLGAFSQLAQLGDGGSAYARALSALSPGGSQAAAAASAAITQGRLDKALSCPAFSGETALLGETTCAWGEGGGGVVDQGGRPGYDGTLWGFATGAQMEVREDWFVGFAAGYENSSFDSSDDLSSADGDTGYAALAVKRQLGGLLLSAAVVGSYGSYDIRRTVSAPRFAGTASGEADLYTVSARGRVAYTVASEFAYLRPFVDIDVIYTHSGGYTETGAGIYNLDVDDQGQTAFVATPAVEVGARIDLAPGFDARLFATAGVSLSTEDEWTTDARLAAAPAAAGTFETTLPVADVLGRIGAGLQLSAPNGFDMRADYEGAFGDEYSSHSGTLRLIKEF